MRTFLFSLIAFFTFIPVILFAQEDNNNLVNLPIGETNSFNDYINAVYLMFISIAALIAVVKIIIAGVKYMFTDIVTQKGEAKRDIQGALLGLLVVLSAVVVLTIINPDLTTFDPDITAIERKERPVITGPSPSTSALETIQKINSSGGKALPMPSDSATNIAACENINQDMCENRGAGSVHCFQGEVTNLANGLAVCSVSPANNVRQNQAFACEQTQTNPGASIKETGERPEYNIDCTGAEKRCEDAGYNFKKGISFDRTLSDSLIVCVDPELNIDSFPCISVGLGQFNCRAAARECLSYGRTPEINPGRDERSSLSSISCNE
jgi:hypothetical protein